MDFNYGSTNANIYSFLFVGKMLNPKTKFLFSFIWFVIVIGIFFISDMKNHFTFFQQTIMIATAFIGLVSFYYRYKKINKSNNPTIRQ